MRRFCIVALGVLMVSACLAQSAEKPFVASTVRGSDTGQGIAGAIVTAMVNDSVPVISTLCDENGAFRLEYPDSATRYLKFEAMGYETLLLRGASPFVGRIENVSLQHRSTELNEVEVTAERLTQNAKMMIAIPSQREVDMSMTSVDLLGFLNLPGLNVNVVTQAVSCYGRRVVFKVNGAPKSLDYIKALSPDKILKIEYQDYPTEKYLGDESVGGVINIVLKERLEGGSIYVYGQMCPYMPVSFINGAFYGSYNYKKSQFEVIYNNDTRDYDKVKYDYELSYFGPSDGYHRTENVVSDNSLMRYITNNITAAYTYSDRERNVLGIASFNMHLFKDHRTQNGMVSIDDKDPFERNSCTQNNDKSPSLDLYFKKGWSGDKELEANFVGTYSTADYRRDFDDHNLENPYSVVNTTTNDYYGLAGEVSYSMPIRNVTFSSGIREEFGYSRNVYTGNKIARLNSTTTDLYGSVFWMRGGFSVYLMGKGSYRSSDDRLNVIRYWRGIGSLQLNYRMPFGMGLSYSCNYSPYAPSLSQLTTIEVENNQNVTNTGNPDLKATHPVVNRLRLTYFHNNLQTYLSVTDQYTRNPIVNFYEYRGDGQFVSTYKNAAYSNGVMASLGFSYKNLFGHFDVDVECTYRYQRYAVQDGYTSHGGWNVYGSISGKFGPVTVNMFASSPVKLRDTYTLAELNPENGITVNYNWRRFRFGVVAYSLYGKYKAWYHESWADYDGMIKQHFLQRMPQSYCLVALRVTYNVNFGKSFQRGKKGLENQLSDDSVIK